MNAVAYDLTQPAENGLRRGYTTGTCVTAAVQAALLKLVCNESPSNVKVALPDPGHFLVISIDRIEVEVDGTVRADVIKDAGDDPDQTHRARLFARVKQNELGHVVFKRGEGVGLVTEPGLQIPVGEPAINPVPRAMMLSAVRAIVCDAESSDEGFDLEIGCENGAKIAQRTFNPRLGIVDGISILGTTGIVEPKSMAAFQASIEIYIRVALGDRPTEIVLAPGNLGQRFARAHLQLPLKQVVQMSNFIGFAFACINTMLAELDYRLPRLWVVGHPGKLAKILDGVSDTHSQQSGSAIPALVRIARDLDLPPALISQMKSAKTVEHIVELLKSEACSLNFWQTVEKRLAHLISCQLERVEAVTVRLFQMDGTPLGENA